MLSVVSGHTWQSIKCEGGLSFPERHVIQDEYGSTIWLSLQSTNLLLICNLQQCAFQQCNIYKKHIG